MITAQRNNGQNSYGTRYELGNDVFADDFGHDAVPSHVSSAIADEVAEGNDEGQLNLGGELWDFAKA